MDRTALERLYKLRQGALPEAIRQAEATLGMRLPPAYVDFLRLSNGLITPGRLVLLEAEDIAGRNADYEVQDYLPGYVMIGDDSGGAALVMKSGKPSVHEADMGVMTEDALLFSAASLEDLLIGHGGRTLAER